jgi:hypothetical protein
MAYTDGEALVLTQLRAVPGFSLDNTARGKWGMLNSGKSDHYGIIKPGKFKTTDRSQIGTIWQTVISIYQRYTDDGVSLLALEANISAVLLRFRQYRKLADTTGTINDSAPISGSEVTEIWTKGGNGPSWLRQDVIIEWSEENHVSYAE